MKPYTFDPEAEAEFLAALARYSEISQTFDRRYYDAIHAVIGEVCRAPTAHRRMPGTREV